MAINIISTPNKTIGSFASDCVSITQVLYELRREDYQADSYSAVGDNITMDSSHGDVTSEFTAGDRIYLGGSPDNEGVYTVESVTTGGPNTIITIAETIPVTDTGTGLYVNNLTTHPGYYLKIRFSELDDALAYFIPDYQGNIYAELSGVLKRLIDIQGTETQPYYQEAWSGGSETELQFTDPIFVTFAKRQLLDNGGANIGELSLQPSPYGISLSLFDEGLQNFPKTWKNWSRFISYLNQDYSAVFINQEFRDINNTFSSSITQIPLTPTPPNIVKQELEPAENASSNEYYLQVHATATGPGIASQTSWYSIEEECKQPVMVEWLNSYGAWDQYLFNFEQAITNQASQGFIYTSPFADDIANITEQKTRLSDNDVQFMTLKALQLSQTDIRALHDIKTAKKVRVWLEKDGTSFVYVIVNNAFETSFTTSKKNYEFTLTIEFPDNFDFFKAKGY